MSADLSSTLSPREGTSGVIARNTPCSPKNRPVCPRAHLAQAVWQRAEPKNSAGTTSGAPAPFPLGGCGTWGRSSGPVWTVDGGCSEQGTPPQPLRGRARGFVQGHEDCFLQGQEPSSSPLSLRRRWDRPCGAPGAITPVSLGVTRQVGLGTRRRAREGFPPLTLAPAPGRLAPTGGRLLSRSRATAPCLPHGPSG